MKNLFVPYHIAVMAKEKGFSELTNYFYSQEGKLMPRILESGDEPMQFEPEDFYENFNTIVKYAVNGKYQNVFSAPLYQQIVDWFREKYDMMLLPKKTLKTNQYFWEIQVNGEWTKETQLLVNYNTYYESLTKAIEEAFKLI